MMNRTDWHTLKPEETLTVLDVNAANGLNKAEVAQRFEKFGPNELKEESTRSVWRMLWEQFTSTMSLILVAAATLSALVGSFRDSATIFAIVLLFAMLGFFQDYRAERAIAALRRMATPMVRVRRNAEAQEIPVNGLVPGDILLLEAGSVVPADAHLLEAHALRVQEALLTGESEAAEKKADALTELEAPLGDRFNMLYMGTQIAAGRAVAVVTATGMSTELGKIATMLQQVGQSWTPLQKRLDRLGKILAVVSIAIAALIFLIGLLRGEELAAMLMMAVSVAVAAIPEGLPAVVTITLALGAQRMLRRNALIRRLPAVETLGSVSVICTDKTGTLTENRMTVCGLEILKGQGARVKGQEDGEKLLLLAGALCNDAQLRIENGEAIFVGDPTEGALLVAAEKQGIKREELEKQFPRIAEIPFDSVSKRMITVHFLAPGPLTLEALPQSGKLLVAKGALDAVLELCSGVISDADRSFLEEVAEKRSAQGERVLALAFRVMPEGSETGPDELSRGFSCIGLTILADPPRAEAREAVLRCLSAGIRPVMITGDHPLTALSIAAAVAIPTEGKALTGVELDRLSGQEFDEATAQVSVYARVTPEHKLRIVESLQKQGLVVSMTGDGVNDAPALKKADVGVAMGRVGTDVAREAADMVLLDDNFATIVAAVEEGRTIYNNIRKFVVFSVAGNLGKIAAVLLLPFMGFPMPLTPLQLLWLNLLTDGLLGLGMGVERPEPDVMKRPPIAGNSQIFDRAAIRYVLLAGLLIGGSCMLASWYVRQSGGPWQTVLFVSLALAQVAQAISLRSFKSSFFAMGLFTNPLLLSMAACVVLLQGAAIYIAVLQGFFRTVALDAGLLGVAFLPALAVFVVLELEKLRNRRRAATSPV